MDDGLSSEQQQAEGQYPLRLEYRKCSVFGVQEAGLSEAQEAADLDCGHQGWLPGAWPRSLLPQTTRGVVAEDGPCT